MAMSKLDFITIIIVAICVGALGFLVFKTVKLMNPDEATPEVIENTDSAYDPADEYALDDEGEVITDDTPADDASAVDSETPADTEEYPVADDGADLDTEDDDPEPEVDSAEDSSPETYDSGSATGAYLVLAGSYKQKINATNQVNKLRKMGYDDASVQIFNSGALAVALVDRFDTYSEANALKKELESKGFDVFIKKK